MEQGKKGAKHTSSAAAGMGAGAGTSKEVVIAEGFRVSGSYGVENVGPLEHERAAYVATRDALWAANGRVRATAGLMDAERTKARRIGPVRRMAKAVLLAIGLAAATVSTPVMADVHADHMRARAEARQLATELASFRLEVKWNAPAPNLVTTVGKNHLLDTELAGSSYSVTGPYMFLIDGSASSAAAGDTMASHAGWTEVGGTNAPVYTGTRKTVAFSAASAGSKASSAASSFAITSAGTVGGCGLVLGSGASATKDNTSGTLYSAGAFTGGSKTVDNGDTLNVTYTATA